MAEEEEVRAEVDAVQAVYGDDCRVVQEFPPHLTVRIKPRTADDSSQQFVEVTLGIKSAAEYPKNPPYVYIVEMKGLDDNRQTHLITSINSKAQELSSCLMLVALCEEAVETLSNMNHPEGNCPLCLYPLVPEDESCTSVPFMKLMSCYHCFHSECIIKWWKWLQEQNGTNEVKQEGTISVSVASERGMDTSKNQHKGNCPVCRKVFDVKDMEHVLDYLGSTSSQLSFAGRDTDEDENVILQSESENHRRQKFDALLKLQQQKSGLIEPRKNLAILPGMFLPEATTSLASSTETSDNQEEGSSLETNADSSINKATTSKHKNSGARRKNRFHNSRRPPDAATSRKQWIKREIGSKEGS